MKNEPSKQEENIIDKVENEEIHNQNEQVVLEQGSNDEKLIEEIDVDSNDKDLDKNQKTEVEEGVVDTGGYRFARFMDFLTAGLSFRLEAFINGSVKLNKRNIGIILLSLALVLIVVVVFAFGDIDFGAENPQLAEEQQETKQNEVKSSTPKVEEKPSIIESATTDNTAIVKYLDSLDWDELRFSSYINGGTLDMKYVESAFDGKYTGEVQKSNPNAKIVDLRSLVTKYGVTPNSDYSLPFHPTDNFSYIMNLTDGAAEKYLVTDNAYLPYGITDNIINSYRAYSYDKYWKAYSFYSDNIYARYPWLSVLSDKLANRLEINLVNELQTKINYPKGFQVSYEGDSNPVHFKNSKFAVEKLGQIRITDPDKTARLVITDNGVGYGNYDQSKLFLVYDSVGNSDFVNIDARYGANIFTDSEDIHRTLYPYKDRHYYIQVFSYHFSPREGDFSLLYYALPEYTGNSVIAWVEYLQDEKPDDKVLMAFDRVISSLKGVGFQHIRTELRDDNH